MIKYLTLAMLMYGFFLVISMSARASEFIEYRWTNRGQPYKIAFEVGDYERCQAQYPSLPHFLDRYERYFLIDPCIDSMARFSQHLWDLAAQNFGNNLIEYVNFAINFVRAFPWRSDARVVDGGDYVRYPYEMLLDGNGDCEDHAILFAEIMSHWCIDSILLDFPNHLAVAVTEKKVGENRSGLGYEYEGTRYLFSEPTSCVGSHCGEAYVGEAADEDKHKTPKILGRVPLHCDTKQ